MLAMTLRRKMGIQIVAMIGGLLIVSAAAVAGLRAVRENYGLATAGYERMRKVFEVGSRLATARAMLQLEHADRERARMEVRGAADSFSLLIAAPGAGSPGAAFMLDAQAEKAVSDAIAVAAKQLDAPLAEGDAGTIASDAGAVSAAIARIGVLASTIRETVEQYERAARKQQRLATRLVAIVSCAVILAAAALGVMQYRAVTIPLQALHAGVRRIATGQFRQRLNPRGDEEFVELTADFNRMAGELDGFYSQLEQKVAEKSRELIRSERLASVGYLAAGVAHEINNPLAVISGYAEMSLESLKSQSKETGAAKAEEIARSLQIICEEAFRCKQITTALLSLARPGEANRNPVCLADVVDKVAAIVGGLRDFRDRRLVNRMPADSAERNGLVVNAAEAEMTQVLLNLTINALEATAAGVGVVEVAGRRRGAWIELTVSDNGRGMNLQTLERIFEPFYTEKKGSAEDRATTTPGAGLGLSIVHAIVESHGGEIHAYSDGIDRGSRFVVKLPARQEGMA